MAAIDAILGLVGSGMGIFSNIMNNQTLQDLNTQSEIHEKEMLGLQYGTNEEAAQNADIRTRALYNDLQSPEAKREQLEKAGMSVGLMYGQGGMGGTLPNGAQAQAATPQNYGRFAPNPIVGAQEAQIIANATKTAAETDLLKQEKKNKQVEEKNAWKDLDIKDKQMIIMDNQVEEIQQGIKESQQRIDNMLEEKINLLETRKDIQASAELKKAQADYNNSLKKLTDIKIEWEPKQQEAQLKNIKALTAQYNAATKKLIAEAKLTEEQTNLLKKQSNDLVKKLSNEILLQEYELNEIKPAIVNEMKEKTYQMQNQNYGEEQRRHYYDWVNRNIGQGCGDFLRIVHEDLLPF